MADINGWKDLRPFDRWVQSNIPTVFGNEMTYYEKLCKVVQAVNDTMNNVNLLHTEFIALNSLYEELKNYVDNYFANLDVQQEINNKLDIMAEDGTLAILVQNKVAYYRTFESFGAIGDGVNDDTNALQQAIDYGVENNVKIIAMPNKNYKISSPINVKNCYVDFNNARIFSSVPVDSLIEININSDDFSDWYGKIEKAILDCQNAERGVNITFGRKKILELLNLINVTKYGIYYNSGYEITVKNCNITAIGDSTTGSNTTVGIYANGGDSNFYDIVIINCYNAINNRGLNFYHGIHAWMRTHFLAQTAKFLTCGGNVPTYISQSYADTYGIIFNMRDAWVIAEQIYTYYNANIYESTFSNPYVFFNENNLYSDYYQRKSTLVNSELQGVSDSLPLIYANFQNPSIKVNYNNIRRINGYSSWKRNDILTDQSDFKNIKQIQRQILIAKNGFMELNIQFQIDTTISKSFILGNLPIFAVPSNQVTSICSFGNNNANTVDGVGRVNIYDQKIRGDVNMSTGNNVYVTIQLVYGFTAEAQNN